MFQICIVQIAFCLFSSNSYSLIYKAWNPMLCCAAARIWGLQVNFGILCSFKNGNNNMRLKFGQLTWNRNKNASYGAERTPNLAIPIKNRNRQSCEIERFKLFNNIWIFGFTLFKVYLIYWFPTAMVPFSISSFDGCCDSPMASQNGAGKSNPTRFAVNLIFCNSEAFTVGK